MPQDLSDSILNSITIHKDPIETWKEYDEKFDEWIMDNEEGRAFSKRDI